MNEPIELFKRPLRIAYEKAVLSGWNWPIVLGWTICEHEKSRVDLVIGAAAMFATYFVFEWARAHVERWARLRRLRGDDTWEDPA